MNVLQYMPTASLMIYVMGLEAAKSRPATNAERKEMQRLLHEGMDAGLVGFSIQRLGPNSTQADFDGTPMVTDTMCDDDIFCLAEVLRERDEGFIQLTQATDANPNVPEDLEFKLRLAEVARRPILDNVVPVSQKNPRIHQERLEWLDEAHEQGLRIYGQGATIRTGFAFSLDNWNLYDSSPAWREATTGTLEEKIAQDEGPGDPRAAAQGDRDGQHAVRQDPARRRRPAAEARRAGRRPPPGHADSTSGKSLGQIAEEEGKHYLDVMLDLSLETDLKTEFLGEGPDFNVDHMAGVYNESPYTIPGVSDGGAHTKFFTGGAWTTDFLAWMVRDERQHHASKRPTTACRPSPPMPPASRTVACCARALRPTCIVYDLDELAIDPAWIGEAVYDLPGGEWRRVQRAHGYRHILVNGVETFTDGECTGATPGKLLRHGKG